MEELTAVVNVTATHWNFGGAVQTNHRHLQGTHGQIDSPGFRGSTNSVVGERRSMKR